MIHEWTDERVSALKELRAQGWSIVRIGAEIGVYRSAVLRKIKKLGLPPPEVPLRATPTRNLPHFVPSFWTPEKDEELRVLAAEKLTTREIAARIGAKSRSAVIGRGRRLKVKFYGQPKTGKPPKPRERRRAVASGSKTRLAPDTYLAEIIPDEPHVVGRPILDFRPIFPEVKNECRYAVTDEAPYLFCGEATEKGGSYCPFHTDLCADRRPRQTVKDLTRFAHRFDRPYYQIRSAR